MSENMAENKNTHVNKLYFALNGIFNLKHMSILNKI